MDRRTLGRTDSQTDGHERTLRDERWNGRTHEQTLRVDGWMNGQTDVGTLGRTLGRRDERWNGWTSGCTDELKCGCIDII